jgi:autotransporter-associated beta strand protein
LDSFTLTLTAKGGKNMNGAISGTGGLRASTQSSVNLRGVNTYTGDTTVLGGTLNLFDDAQLKFVIGANGVNNMITSNGADDNGVLQVNGDFLLDLTGAGTNVGDAWTIVDISSDLVTTFGETFNVTGFTSTGTAGSRVWTADANGVTYAFAEPTGLLTVVPEPATTVLLLTGLAGLIARRKR